MISVHAGQCGNQLGYCILDSLHEHLSDDEEIDFFFRRSEKQKKWIARSVCLDTEPKVIHECFERANQTKAWAFDEYGAAYEHGGAGNNWAMGYQMCTGPFRDASMDCIRRELEEVDVSSVIGIYHSIGGGTGSGLGTRITEEIRDEFASSFILNVAVMPYHFGEVVVQHYNSVLCLSKIAASSDAIMLFENENAHNLCRTMRGIERPSLYDVNRTITACTLPALLPKRSPSSTGPPSRGARVSLMEDIAHLCSHPNFKFIDVKSTPQTSTASIDFTYDSWSTMLRTLERMDSRGTIIERDSTGTPISARDAARGSGKGGMEGGRREKGGMGDVCRNVASVLTLHGIDADITANSILSLSPQYHNQQQQLGTQRQPSGTSTFASPRQQHQVELARFSSNYVPWSVSPCKVYASPYSVNGYLRSASLVSNGQTVLPSLQRPLLNGANMFRSGAYVHQYQSCGLEADDFVTAFRSLGQIVNNYTGL